MADLTYVKVPVVLTIAFPRTVIDDAAAAVSITLEHILEVIPPVVAIDVNAVPSETTETEIQAEILQAEMDGRALAVHVI
jgi:hypothetical protein